MCVLSVPPLLSAHGICMSAANAVLAVTVANKTDKISFFIQCLILKLQYISMASIAVLEISLFDRLILALIDYE